jgi:5-hydroxyisourate hydrolase
MSCITTHVLDTSRGRPAAGVPVRLERGSAMLASDRTDADGRVRDLLPPHLQLHAGGYRLVFETGVYFRAQGVEAFYPHVTIDFEIRDPAQHYHVPLLLSPFGYSTYRGS